MILTNAFMTEFMLVCVIQDKIGVLDASTQNQAELDTYMCIENLLAGFVWV